MLYGNLTAVTVHYDATGTVTPRDQAAFLAALGNNAPDDVIVISHGWNNNEAEADALYQSFFTAAASVWGSFPKLDPAKFLVLAVIWPSKKFDESAFAAAVAPSSAPAAAAAIGPVTVDAEIASQLTTLKLIANNAASAALLDHAIAQIPLLAVSQSAQDDFVGSLARAFPGGSQQSDPGLDGGLALLNTISGHDALARIATTLSLGATPARTTQVGGAAQIGGAPIGAAAGINPLDAIKNAALALANVTTYWTMKERAGVIGQTGVAQTIAKALVAAPNLKVHLVGHSFGGRLVTAAANALTGGTPGHQVETMMLLEAAYSHYGIAQNYQPNTDGIYRSVLTSAKVRKEVQITHSVHDIAVGLAYPIASAIANQIGQALWVNPWGGMGGDGAQATPEAFDDTLQAVGYNYAPVVAPRIVRNLNGDSIIMSHGDVTHPQIAYAMLNAV